MAGKQKKGKLKTIGTLNFNKNCPVDRKLIATVNAFCSLPENEGLQPTSLVRNYLIRKMQEDIDNSRQQKRQAS